MLVAYAQHQFVLGRRTKDGLTERDHLLAAQRMAPGIVLPELVSPPIHDWLLYLWEWFAELHSARQSGLGVQPLSWSDIFSWSRLTGRRPTPWEVDCLRKIDKAHLDAVSKK